MPLSNQPADPRCALLVIDMQYDFMPGGQLAVADGDALLPLINRLGARFARVIVTQDWHRPGTSRLPQAMRSACRSRASPCPTAHRRCGRITACKAATARNCMPTSICLTRS